MKYIFLRKNFHNQWRVSRPLETEYELKGRSSKHHIPSYRPRYIRSNRRYSLIVHSFTHVSKPSAEAMPMKTLDQLFLSQSVTLNMICTSVPKCRCHKFITLTCTYEFLQSDAHQNNTQTHRPDSANDLTRSVRSGDDVTISLAIHYGKPNNCDVITRNAIQSSLDVDCIQGDV